MREKLRALWLGQRDRLLTLTIAVALVFAIVHAWPRALPPSRHVDVAPSPGRMGSFVPNPTNAGPLYVKNGELTAGAGNFTQFLLGKEPVLSSGPIDAGACTTMVLDPSQVACGEAVADDALVEIKILGDLNAPPLFTKLEFLGGGNCSTGTITTADGGTFGSVIAAPVYPPLLIDASASWSVVSDAGLAVNLCSPGTATTYANISLSAVHALPQFQGTSTTQLDAGGHYVLAPYPSTVPVVIDGGAAYTFVTTYGDMVGATGGSFSNGSATFTCSTFTIINEHLATCVLATGLYDAGTGADASLTVAVAGASNSPAACPGCATATVVAAAPTVTAMVPAETSSAGGETVAIIGANFVNGTTTFKFGANAATSVTCASNANYLNCSSAATCCTMTVPDTGVHVGAGSLQPVTAANGALTGAATNVALYTSATSAPLRHFNADAKVTGGATITSWGDNIGSNNWTASGGQSPSTCTAFNSTSHNCIQFNGTANTMLYTPGTPPAGPGFTECATYIMSSVAATQTVWNATATNLAYQYNTTTQFVTQTDSTVIGGGTVNTSAHHVCAIFGVTGGTNASFVCVDGTCTAGTLITAGTITLEYLGSIANASSWFVGKMVWEEEWPYALNTSTEIPVEHAISQVAYGTP